MVAQNTLCTCSEIGKLNLFKAFLSINGNVKFKILIQKHISYIYPKGWWAENSENQIFHRYKSGRRGFLMVIMSTFDLQYVCIPQVFSKK